MFKYIQLILSIGLAVGLAACSSIRANSDYYAEADFSQYRSYAWISDMPFIIPDGYDLAVSALNQRRIKEAVEAELASKGFLLITDAEPVDFVVSLTVGTRDRLSVEVYPDAYRVRWGWSRYPFYYGERVDTREYTEGILAIDIFDESTKQPVWHGWAKKEIRDSDIENAEE